MHGWTPYTIGDVCTVIAGQSPAGKFYNDTGDGLPFYQGKKDFGSKHIQAPTKWTTHVTKEAENGDVLMSVRAPVGPINFATEKICIGRGLAAIRANEHIDRDFLFYGLLYRQPEINGNEGAVFASINKKQIEDIPFPLPPLSEQRRIVGILDEAFAGIDKIIANTEQNLSNARELFESYLNNAFTQKSDGWAEKKLGDLLSIQNGYAFNSKQFSPEGDLALIRIRDLKRGYDTETRYSGEYDEKYIVRAGDYLIGMDGEFTCYEWKGEDALLNQRVCRLEHFSDSLDARFLFYGINKYLKAIEDVTAYTTVKHLSAKQITEISLPLPPLSEQKQMVDQLDQLSSATRNLEAIYQQKLDALNELKQSILQRAFSGDLPGGNAAAP